MIVPIVPFVPHTNVVNKTIVYSDTVLPLKDAGCNLKVTSISNIEQTSLEDCLKIIFESNPNVIFITIQYSKNEKKVYFYTDTEISKKAWEDSKISTYTPLTSSSEILEELKNVLLAEKNNEDDCISLYDVAKLMKTKNRQYDKTKKSYESYLNDIIENKYSNAKINIYNFDYENNELRIGFKYIGDDYDEISFSKYNGDLFLTKSESYRGKEVFTILCGSLSKLYDEFMEYKDFIKQSNYCFKSVNSKFLIGVSRYGVSMFVRNPSKRAMNDFELSSHSNSKGYYYDCNSNIVTSAFKGKEKEIFKRIFIKISDCPGWSQPILYETRKNQLAEAQRIRQQQLAEEQRIEEEQRYREMKRQKRLQLVRKIFPWKRK